MAEKFVLQCLPEEDNHYVVVSSETIIFKPKNKVVKGEETTKVKFVNNCYSQVIMKITLEDTSEMYVVFCWNWLFWAI